MITRSEGNQNILTTSATEFRLIVLERLVTSMFSLQPTAPTSRPGWVSFFSFETARHSLCAHANMLTIQESLLQLPICQSAITTITPFTVSQAARSPPRTHLCIYQASCRVHSKWSMTSQKVSQMCTVVSLILKLDVNLHLFWCGFCVIYT